MPLTLGQLASVIDDLAPFRLAYDWDNVGLQVGDPSATVDHLLVALEVNDDALARARKHRCTAILAHHPLIFQPMRTLRGDDVAGRLVLELAKSGIGLIAAHTNLDRVLHGTNGILAALLGLRDVRILEPHALHDLVKFVVFVPPDHTPKIIEAIHRGGGGTIGNYTRCTFRARGTGTYLPGEGANPFAGETGRFEQAEEDRLEAVVPRNRLQSVVREVVQAHPYEEVAYDVVALHDAQPRHGLGVTGRLAAKSTLAALARRVGEVCSADSLAIIGKPGDDVRRVAIITGSAGSSLRGIRPDDTDVLITGELSYHFATEARDRGLRVILAGHAATEKVFAPAFAATLSNHDRIREAGLSIHPFDIYPEPALPVEMRRPRTKGK